MNNSKSSDKEYVDIDELSEIERIKKDAEIEYTKFYNDIRTKNKFDLRKQVLIVLTIIFIVLILQNIADTHTLVNSKTDRTATIESTSDRLTNVQSTPKNK